MVILASQRAGWSLEVIGEYFNGNEKANIFPKTTGEMLELSHFHLFTIPLMLLVQGHIFVMSSFPKKHAVKVVGLSYLSGALYIASPWLIIYGGASLAIAGLLGRSFLVITLFIMTIFPLVDMWKHK